MPDQKPDFANRLPVIDAIRGLVMVIMALDHVRDFLHTDALTSDPLDLATTTPLLYFTRWITHLCAPTFVFLSGVSVALSMKRYGNTSKQRQFLVKRGLWLILLELTLINFALWFDIQFRLFLFQVIGTIGAGFILLALLVRLPRKALIVIGFLILLFHDLALKIPNTGVIQLDLLISLFLKSGFFQVAPNTSILIGYPVIPWLGIMLLGFISMPVFLTKAPSVFIRFRQIGLTGIAAFLLLRFVNGYGNSSWNQQADPLFTMLSFLNVDKYPPSLLYTLVFLGIMFLILSLLPRLPEKVISFLTVFGRVPLFYYLLHFYLIRLALFVMVFLQGFSWSDLLFGPFQFGRPATGSGIALGYVYMVWILVVAILYPICLKYSRYKAAHPEKTWLKYL